CAPAGYAAYQWNYGQTTPCIYARQAGNYYVTVTDNSGCTANSNHLALAVHSLPPVSISLNGDTLNVYNATAYQWYLDGKPLAGDTGSTIIATSHGSYTVEVMDTNGCTSLSSPIHLTGIETMLQPASNIYPNPTGGSWHLSFSDDFKGADMGIWDGDGRCIYQSKIDKEEYDIKI